MDNNLIINARDIVNKAKGSCIAVNSIQYDSDALAFINDTEVYVHFRNRIYKDINIPLSEIKDIKFDIDDMMKIVHLYSNDGQVVSIFCL
jgi:hypothetical protein